MRLTTRITPLDELTESDLVAWRDLALRVAEPNPFFEPEFLLPAAAALAPGAISLAVVEDGDGRWTGAAAVRFSRRWRRLPIPCLELWAHEYSGLEVPLVDRSVIGPTVTALVTGLRGRRGTPLVAMTQIPADGPYATALAEALGAAAQPVVVERYERAALRRRAEPTYAAEAMSKRRRQELARLRRGLEKEHSVATADLAGDRQAVERFLAIEGSGWKGREGTALACDPAHARFFREMCAGFAAAGRLEMLALTVDGTPIAMRCNLRSGDRIFGFKMAFDEAWARWSPGRLADMDAIGHFHDRTDAALMDSISHPGNAYMNGMWPDRLRLCTMLVPGRGAAGWAAGRAAAAGLGFRAVRERRAAPGRARRPRHEGRRRLHFGGVRQNAPRVPLTPASVVVAEHCPGEPTTCD